MGGIRTSAAAEVLGVSPSTLRTWERRLGYPQPRRSAGNHREYDLTEIELLRDVLQEVGNISAAVSVAKERGRLTSSPSRLAATFHTFDEAASDREVEEALAVRSFERTVEDLLLPAIDAISRGPGYDAELEHACRWATGWLHGARRFLPRPTRPEGVLILDSGPPLRPEAIHVQALGLFLRRAGLRILLLSADLADRRFSGALRMLQPRAIVLGGAEARLDVIGPQLRKARAASRGARVWGYRTARLVSGRQGMPSLGESPTAATEMLLAGLDAE